MVVFYHREYTRVNQKFCNVLVTWNTIQQLQILLPRSGIEADGINSLLVLTLANTVQQRQTWGRMTLSFGWATFGWVSCNIDTFV